MDWEKLMSAERLRESSTEKYVDRTQYQKDYDRIIFSKPFRRLQKKTQVFPLPEHDFIHTRLTHSLETSCIGRSLGMVAGAKIIENYPELKKTNISAHDFAAVVAAASLGHDLGNPPFGHSGEDAISDFFKNEGAPFIKDLPDEQKLDFQKFEGNAMGFRLLVSTLPGVSRLEGGINLTFATLGAFAKYPKEVTMDKIDGISGKKHNFFQSEKEIFIKIADSIGLIKRACLDKIVGYYRHPLAFLVEAADDISYCIMDLEDGCNLKLIDNKRVQELLLKLIQNKDNLITSDILDQREQVGYLRALAISSLIKEVTGVFEEKLPEIMKGKFDSSIAEHISSAQYLNEIREICRKEIYSYRKVLEIEAAGFEVLGGLLYEFLNAITGTTEKAKKIRCLLPNHYIAKDYDLPMQKYETVMHIVQFVAGMTDTFAIDTYRTMKGIRLPNY